MLPLAAQAPEPPRGWVDAPIGRGRRPTERRIGGKNAVAARSHYAMVRESQGVAMVAVEPQTGRTHQIRVHLAHVGAPLVGDERYGASKRLVLASGTVLRPGRIALHAAWVEMRFEDGKPWRVDAPLPVDLRSIWTSVGGADDAWEPALAPLESEPPSTDASRRGRLAGGESR